VTEWKQGKKGVESTLTSRLDAGGERFVCGGSRPWLYQSHSDCGEDMVAVLRSASNLYFATVETAIFVPEAGELDAELLDILQAPVVAPILNFICNAQGPAAAVEPARATLPEQLAVWSDQSIEKAIATIFGEKLGADADSLGRIAREPEWAVLREVVNHPDLVVRAPAESAPIEGFGRRRVVPALKETRVLTGFGRLKSSAAPDIEASKALLRRKALHGANDWLPAYVVKGEGIYFELDPTALADWELLPDVLGRVSKLAQRLAISSYPLPFEVSPRFVLLHTLAHVLINQMVLSSGYSSASLRERIFSGTSGSDMAGVLIYTASGDSDGTLGGLVRMGETDSMRRLLAGSLDAAAWCANDPVCMELGEAGQGPEGCNSAACHSCCLLPETACEHYNKGLDRGLLLSQSSKTFGYFDQF
jgi:hypothetical protein